MENRTSFETDIDLLLYYYRLFDRIINVTFSKQITLRTDSNLNHFYIQIYIKIKEIIGRYKELEEIKELFDGLFGNLDNLILIPNFIEYSCIDGPSFLQDSPYNELLSKIIGLKYKYNINEYFIDFCNKMVEVMKIDNKNGKNDKLIKNFDKFRLFEEKTNEAINEYDNFMDKEWYKILGRPLKKDLISFNGIEIIYKDIKKKLNGLQLRLADFLFQNQKEEISSFDWKVCENYVYKNYTKPPNDGLKSHIKKVNNILRNLGIDKSPISYSFLETITIKKY